MTANEKTLHLTQQFEIICFHTTFNNEPFKPYRITSYKRQQNDRYKTIKIKKKNKYSTRNRHSLNLWQWCNSTRTNYTNKLIDWLKDCFTPQQHKKYFQNTSLCNYTRLLSCSSKLKRSSTSNWRHHYTS